jgi:predicted Zn-dependent peptidase
MEDSRNVSGWLGGQEILTGRILTPDQIISIIDAITTEELTELARELIDDSKLHLAVVGPVTEDEPLTKLLSI